MGSEAATVANIPAAARRQGKQAEEIHRAVYGTGEAAPAPAAPPGDGAPTAQVVELQPPAAQPQPAPEQPTDGQQDVETAEHWKNKYNVLKGKYNREISPLQQQLREANSRVRELTTDADTLRHMIATLQTAAPAPAASAENNMMAPGQRYVTDTDVEEFGEDTIDMVRRAAREEAAAMQSRIASLEAKLQSVGQTVQLSARDKLLATLDDSVQNWRAVNRDEAFLAWLDEADPYSGMRRHDLLKRAFESNDAARVVAFFKGFLGENAVLSGPSPAQAQQTAGPSVSLETLVAPGRPREGSVRAQEGGKRIWTSRDIKAFYRDVNDKKFVGREADRTRIEREIFEATREGRVQA